MTAEERLELKYHEVLSKRITLEGKEETDVVVDVTGKIMDMFGYSIDRSGHLCQEVLIKTEHQNKLIVRAKDDIGLYWEKKQFEFSEELNETIRGINEKTLEAAQIERVINYLKCYCECEEIKDALVISLKQRK